LVFSADRIAASTSAIARATFSSYCLTHDLSTHFIVRMQTDRLAGDGDHTISDEMDEVAIKGLHRVEVRNENGAPPAGWIRRVEARLRNVGE
jgi:hypothetical protein